MRIPIFSITVLFFFEGFAAGMEQDICFTNVIIATGVGKYKYKPSISLIRLGIEAIGQNPVQVQQEVSRAAQNLFKLLHIMNVSKLKTNSISLKTNYNSRGRKRVVSGYSASTVLSFEVAIEKTNVILDASIRYGATAIRSVSFRADPKITANARQNAIRNAVWRARSEAEIALYTLGHRLDSPVSIQITDTFFDAPVLQPGLLRSYSQLTGSKALLQSTSIISAEQIVHAYVSVTFSIA